MKYTKYNVRGIRKPQKNNKFLVLIVLCILLTFLFATILKNVLFKGTLGDKLPTLNIDNLKKEFKLKKNNPKLENEENKTTRMDETEEKSNKKETNSTEDKDQNIESEGKYIQFYCVQCGVFKNEENAKNVLNSVDKVGNPFIIKEGDLFKVVNGVFKEEYSNKLIEQLAKSGVEGAKIKFKLKKDGKNTEEISKIMDGLIKVLDKLNEKDVKEIKTDDIKKWTSSLKKEDENASNYKELKSIKAYVEKLPNKLKKSDLIENYKFLYKYLVELNKSDI